VVLALVSEVHDLTAAEYFPFALAGAFVIHMSMKPARRDVYAVLAAAAVFAMFYVPRHTGDAAYFGSSIGWPGEFLGL